MQLKKTYTCTKCNKKVPQLNWSFELREWICVDCYFRTPATIRKDPKDWKYVLK